MGFLSIYRFYSENFRVEYVKLIYAMIIYLSPRIIKVKNIIQSLLLFIFHAYIYFFLFFIFDAPLVKLK